MSDELRLPLKDHIAPHNLEAEEATLGALMLDWEAVDKVSFLDPSRFYSRRNQLVFEGIRSLYQKGQTGDYRLLIEELRSAGTLEAAGGEGYIVSLPDKVATVANVTYYAQIVLENGVRRELIKAAAEITAQAHDQTITSRQTLEDAQKRIFELTDLHRTHEILDVQKVVDDTVAVIQERSTALAADGITGVPSGLIQLDEMTSGFHAQELVIIGARPGMGKTALALSMLQHISVEKQIPAGFFSLEMSYTEIGQRMLAQIGRLPQDKMRKGLLSPPQWGMINDAAARFYDAPIYTVDSPGLTMLDIRALARNMVSNHGVRIIFIDYISLITAENAKMERWQQVAEFSRSLKGLARELKIPLVVLSQVSRGAEGKAPSLAELRESGAIEQDADMVIFINRERGTGNDPTIPATLNLAKQRNGPTGFANCLFIPQYTKFENGTPDRDQ